MENTGAQMLENAVCFTLRISSLGNARKVNTNQVETDADRTMIAVTKHLFDSDEFRAIKKLDGDIRQYLYSRALPAFFMRDGVYLLPTGLIPQVERKLQEFATRRAGLVGKFIDVYPDLIREAETRLRSLFDPSDYRSADSARGQFSLDWQYVTFGVPDKLQTIDPELFQREQEKAVQKWAEATTAVQDVLRTNMQELVTHLVDRLSGNGNGKPKIFRNSMLENIQDFLGTFDFRNITGDEQLATLVTQAKELLQGASPDRLRESNSFRTRVAEGFAEIQGKLDTLMVDKPSRAITFED